MNTFGILTNTLLASAREIGEKFVSFIPTLITALIILYLGVAIAVVIGGLVKRLVGITKVDALLDASGLGEKCKHLGIPVSIGSIIGWIVKWFFIIIVIVTVADTLGLDQINVFLKDVAFYIPNVIVAVILLAIGLVAGHGVHEMVNRAATASSLKAVHPETLATVARWAIIIFAVMASLIQLGIAERLIEIFFTGLVIALSLAFGLAFGLGGKKKAREIIESCSKHTPHTPHHD